MNEEIQRRDFNLPESLFWLMDASMFIDDALIDRYYDAIVRPLHTKKGRVIRITEDTADKISGKLGIGAKVSPSDLMGKLLRGFFDLELSAEAGIEGESAKRSSRDETVTLEPINTPHRRLEQLALHYLVNVTDRIFLEADTQKTEWRDSTTILKTPRALAFFNLPSQSEAREKKIPETRMIPAAAEFENGEVVPLYQNLKFDRWVPPQYPQEKDVGNDLEKLHEERKKYWADFAEHYSATVAMLAIENASRNRGRIRWIAFRVPLANDGTSLHLHVHAAEKYDTGTFAYNFVKRGHKHGLRIVGMLKSEPDLNVLAVYEK